MTYPKPVRMAKIKKSENAKYWQGCAAIKSCWWEYKMEQPLGKSLADFNNVKY